jgi:hypothetical protein
MSQGEGLFSLLPALRLELLKGCEFPTLNIESPSAVVYENRETRHD